MRVKQVNLANFRNLSLSSVELIGGRNILIGQNAQGKSNFLEAIELLATGKSWRADQDLDLIGWGCKSMSAGLVFETSGNEETLSIALRQPPETGQKRAAPGASGPKSERLEKTMKVNGLTQTSVRGLIGRLIVVSFKSQDLNLLRGGPKFRRDWIDSLILKLRPGFHDVFSSYQKIVAQRNRLLKTLLEKGKVTVSDQDQLLVWDKQLARYGARIIRQRLELLFELLPLAQEQQGKLSSRQESLSIRYLFRAEETGKSALSQDDQLEGADFDSRQTTDNRTESAQAAGPLSTESLLALEEIDLARLLLKLMKERRFEEIRRRQSLVGPHRDDIVFRLNDADAVSFASQGQQRSLVLSLKLAELKRITASLNEHPVLLLDDVLAELDTQRQAQLLGAVEEGMQTIITTTHVSGFDPFWLEGARIFTVAGGTISADRNLDDSSLILNS